MLSAIAALSIYFSQNYQYLLVLVPFMVFFRTAFNALDGLVSRELKIASQFGEVLNELIDRIADAMILLSIALLPETDLLLGTLVIIVVLINSYLSILSKASGGSRQYGGIMGKADRMLYIGLAAIIAIFWKNEIWTYLLFLILIGTIITFIQRFYQTKKELT